MRYAPSDLTALLRCLDGQPDNRRVMADADTGIQAGDVRELRGMSSWPPGLVVTTPRENYPESEVRISKAV